MHNHDVLVAGGGVIGLAIAWRAAARGLSVAIADPAPGTGASNVAAGMLATRDIMHLNNIRDPPSGMNWS